MKISELHRKTIRHRLRLARNAMPEAHRQTLSMRIAYQVFAIPEFHNSHSIAFYSAHDGEVNADAILQEAQRLNKMIYLAVLHTTLDHFLEFYTYRAGDALIKNRFGIEEPDPMQQSRLPAQTLDLVFLPLVAFDVNGNRLGRGAGYYDRTFAFLRNSPIRKPVLIGLGYECQKIDSLAPCSWDVPLDMVVTEETLYRF